MKKMTRISTDSIVVVTDDVVSCDLDGEAAILNIKDGVYYGLDPIGAKIWNLIQKPILLDNVLQVIMDEYDVDKDRCKNDILELIEKLLENGLVKINE
jgi:hypothetical protein